MRFDKIMPSLKNEEVDGGLVIHEGRFTFNQYNLTKVTDLGVEWESNSLLLKPYYYKDVYLPLLTLFQMENQYLYELMHQLNNKIQPRKMKVMI